MASEKQGKCSQAPVINLPPERCSSHRQHQERRSMKKDDGIETETYRGVLWKEPEPKIHSLLQLCEPLHQLIYGFRR